MQPGSNSLKAAELVQCGACGHANSSGTNFCEGCGHNLYEPCGNCGKSVVLTQKFCGACGADLEEATARTHKQHEHWMATAVESAKNYDFDHAAALLGRIASLTDYRYKEAADGAATAIEKIEAMKKRSMDQAAEMYTRAKAEADKGNHLAVVRLLKQIPEKLMSEDAKKILNRVQAYTNELSELESAVQQAIAEKNWQLVGGLVEQLLSHSPEEQAYLQIAEQVGKRLRKEAQAYFEKGRYDRAVERLESVPSCAQPESFDQTRQRYDDTLWLSRQFDDEPYVTPLLGRLAVRFSKDVPENKEAAEQVKQFAGHLKTSKRPPRSPYPAWKGSAAAWIGGDATLLGFPTAIEIGDHNLLKSCGARFHVAIGLSLQGLGHARVSEHFAPKKGLFKSIGWRKKKPVWGIDLGSASIKAVCLEETDDGITVIDTYYNEFEAPTCRTSGVDAQDVIQEAVTRFAEEKEIGDTPVWINVPAADLVNRFVRLPPVSDKQADNLLTAEIDQKIPIPAEDLSVVRWLGEQPPDDAQGRPALVSAAKRTVVEQRYELLTEAGLKIAGFQGDPIAMVNFLAFEFSDLISPPEDEPEPKKKKKKKDKQEEEVPAFDPDAKSTAIAAIESGAKSTTLIIVSGEAHWFWSLETGGEDLTSALARATKQTHAEAEKQKRNPAAIEKPSKHYQAVSQRLDETRARLEKAYEDAQRQNTRFDVVESWAMGGGCLAHQWMRRTMLKQRVD